MLAAYKQCTQEARRTILVSLTIFAGAFVLGTYFCFVRLWWLALLWGVMDTMFWAANIYGVYNNDRTRQMVEAQRQALQEQQGKRP